jgi:hypothetical protein
MMAWVIAARSDADLAYPKLKVVFILLVAAIADGSAEGNAQPL